MTLRVYTLLQVLFFVLCVGFDGWISGTSTAAMYGLFFVAARRGWFYWWFDEDEFR